MVLDADRQLVIFKLADEEYGVDILDVHEINRAKDFEITRVPKTPRFIEGIISLRGDIIPVIDLRKRFGIAEKTLDEETMILVVNVGEKKVGMQVDGVKEVLTISKDNIEPPPEQIAGLDAKFIEGIGKYENRLLILLNLDLILNTSEKIVLEEFVQESAV